MGIDKAWLAFGEEALAARAVRRASAQAAPLVISANGDFARFEALGCEVIPDAIGDGSGPLAGIVSAMARLRAGNAGSEALASFACDTPFFPEDVIARLAAAQRPRTIVVAASGGRLHPAFGLWPFALENALRAALAGGASSGAASSGAAPSMHRILERIGFDAVDFPVRPFDPFFNINTSEDLEAARKLLSSG
jgi:molybdopterin-guanine dinucleotide biosynthesis protein A